MHGDIGIEDDGRWWLLNSQYHRYHKPAVIIPSRDIVEYYYLGDYFNYDAPSNSR